jgi:EAL domain-containing protein (putative c-di-GMP-specific phosphodiesterase class I)
VERLNPLIRDAEMFVRFGGDQFAILLRNSNLEETTRYAQRIQDALHSPFVIEEIPLDISATIGVALWPDHSDDAQFLIQRAEVAMFLGKKFGDGCYVYNPDQDPYNTRRLMIVGELRHAIDHDQLVLHYQPKIDLQSNRLIGVEALVRWQHPKYGFMPPDQFIPLAEQTGLIKPLTRWVLNEALRQVGLWRKAGCTIGVAVNLSARNLQDIELVAEIEQLLRKWEVEPRLLKLEITESTFMANLLIAAEVLVSLNNMGIEISIDDFGTGHSSLAYLKKLPTQELKIDKSFIKDIGTDYHDVHIVQSIINLGHNVGMTVIAEGVENQETSDRLKDLGCDAIQGFHISRPIPADKLLAWIKNRSRT